MGFSVRIGTKFGPHDGYFSNSFRTATSVHGSVHTVRVDGVHADVELAEFFGRSLRESDESEFRCRIVDLAGHRLESCDRADDDDGTAVARLDHRGCRSLEGLEHAREVDVDELFELVVGHFPESVPRADTSIGHHHVEPAELRHALVDDGFQCGAVTNVADAGHDLAAGFLDRPDRLLEIVLRRLLVGGVLRDRFRDVDSDDRCAFAREPQGMVSALSARNAGDEDDLSVEFAHCSRSLRWSSRTCFSFSRLQCAAQFVPLLDR